MCGDQHDLVDGYPTGSVRISFGYMSTYEDADVFLGMIEKCFVTHPIVIKKRKLENDFYYIKNKTSWEVTSDKIETVKPIRKMFEDEYIIPPITGLVTI